MFYEFLKNQYLMGKIDDAKLNNFVTLNKITEAESAEIKTLKTQVAE